MTKVWQVSGDVDEQVVGAVDDNVSGEVVIEVLMTKCQVKSMTKFGCR
jgi:hypothetical protein